MQENVVRAGGTAIMVDDAWGKAIDPQKLEDALKEHDDARIVAFVHAETSTGALSDAKTLCEIARKHGCLTLVDSVTSLAGVELLVDEWGIDAIYSGTQKCLSCTPGLSPVSFSDAALEKIKNRQSPVQSWFMDLNLVMGYWGENAKRSYHHTAPINALYALHESLVILQEEGLENSWARHRQHHLALRAGLEAMGISFVVDEADRLPQLNSVYLPEGVDDAAVRGRLLQEYGLEIGAGLGEMAGKIWRIGLMGTACSQRNVTYCLSALESVLGISGGVTAAAACYG